MSRDSRSRRSPRPPSGLPPDHAAAAGAGGTGTDLGTAPRPLVSLLAEARRITDVLPHLHQHAIDATREAAPCMPHQGSDSTLFPPIR